MTKRKLLIAAGPVVLAIAAFLTTSANRKFAGAVSAYFFTSGGKIATLFKAQSSSVSNLTSAGSPNKTAFFSTSVNVTHTLFKTKASSTSLTGTLFFK